MTQTNGMAQEMPTLDAMLNAVEKLGRNTRKPLTEYKIYPDDWAALSIQMKPHLITLAPNGPPELCGLRILLDYSAERLPTKKPNK